MNSANHGERAHSTLGASSASRWMACPASVKNLEENPLPSSAAADDGTYTHEVAEQDLRLAFGEELVEPRLKRDSARQERVDIYVNQVLDVAAELADKYGADDVEYGIEEEFAIPYIDEDCWGTNDAAVWVDMGELHVFDLKDGRGPVSAVENKQLMYYALGIIYKHQLDVNKVVLHIVQPKLDEPHSVWTINTDILTNFAHTLKNAVVEVRLNPDKVVVGEDQCRWCNTATCPERTKSMQKKAGLAFPEEGEMIIPKVGDMPTEELIKMIKYKSAFKKIFEDGEATLKQRAKSGQEIEGYKLVQSLGNTTWLDPERAEEVLTEGGDDDIYEPRKLKSPTQMKKVIDPKLVDKLSHRPDNGVKLVKNSTKGIAVTVGFESVIEGLE